MRKYIYALSVLLALAVSTNAPAQNPVTRVRNSSSSSYSNIYAAASSGLQSGDEIRISGTTTEKRTINITCSVTITNGTNAGVVNASESGTGTKDLEYHGESGRADNRCLFKISGSGTVVTLKGNVTYNGGDGIDISLFRVQDGAKLVIDSENVTIQNSIGAVMAQNDGTYSGTDLVQFHAGGGIWINGGDVELKAGTITNNKAQLGAGIFISNDHGTLVMSGGKVTANKGQYLTASGAVTYVPLGAGIFVSTSHGSTNTKTDITISGGEISSNEIEKPSVSVGSKTTYSCGGGLYARYAWTKISGGSITNNSVPNDTDAASVPTSTVYKSNGGGISISGGGKLTITGSPTISGNKAERGGAIHVSGKSEVTFDGITFSGNKSTVCGGAAFIEGNGDDKPLFNFVGVTFAQNQALGGGGGAIQVDDCQGASVLDDCVFNSNYSRFRGGAILVNYNQEPSFHINGLTTTGNSANDEWTYLNHGGNVIAIQANEWAVNTKYPTIQISGEFNCAESDEVFLFGKTYLTKCVDTAKGYSAFTITDTDGKLDVLVDDKNDNSTIYQHVFNGRDILVSADSDSKVLSADLSKFNVKFRDELRNAEKFGFYLSPKYDDSGFNNFKNVSGSTDDVIELRCLGMMRITRSGLQTGESAIYNVYKGSYSSMPSTDPLYTVQMTGVDTDGTDVSKELIYLENGTYTVFENAWDWTYNSPVTATAYKSCTVADAVSNPENPDLAPVPWAEVSFTGSKLSNVPVNPYDEAFDGDSTGVYKELNGSSGGTGNGNANY